MTPAERNDDGEIVEPPNSTVDAWLGQQARGPGPWSAPSS